MRTLHLYLGRELLKTFFMTSLALTLLVVMGGGVANIFKGEGIGAEEVAKVFAFLTPVAITLILPVAALFSAAICYGRAAADNEITACRAAGINIQRLLLSAALLGSAVTAFTYWSWNYLIPRLCQEIEDTTRRELHNIVVTQFQKARPLVFSKYRLTAGRCEPVPPEQVPEDLRDTHTYLLLKGVTFLEMDGQEVVRFGTAETTVLDFDRHDRAPKIKADLQHLVSFDAARGQSYQLDNQLIGPFEIPIPVKRKIKFENLPALLDYRRHPDTIPDIKDRIAGIKRMVATVILDRDIAERFDPERNAEHKYILESPTVRYEIMADRFKVDPENGKPTLGGVRVDEKFLPAGRHHVYNADTATFELRSTLKPENPVILVQLRGNVGTRTVPHVQGERLVKKESLTLEPVDFAAQPALRTAFESVDVPALVTGTGHVAMPPDQSRQMSKVNERVGQLLAEVTGEIHFRASYAVSVIAMILIGATLGIIVRGGQVLTAFGISCMPTLFVVIACIVGRNLADKPNLANASLLVMWGSTVLLFAAFAFFVTKVLRR